MAYYMLACTTEKFYTQQAQSLCSANLWFTAVTGNYVIINVIEAKAEMHAGFGSLA